MRAALLMSSLVVLGVAVGCGSSAPTKTEQHTTEHATTSAVPAEHGAFAHCLSEHGVSEPSGPAIGPAPGPVAPPAGVDQQTWDQAMQACSSLAPGPPGP